jgi:hypothetical protein
MHIIDSPITFGAETTFQNLTVVPLLGGGKHADPIYDTLDAALGRGAMRITEVSADGHVPEIKVRNDAERPVLIIDGEELVGAKQNRTVNLSMLVPAHADLHVPVTCVEAGRWRARSTTFEASPRTHFARGRASKSRQVSESLLEIGLARADQQQVWEEIAERAERHQVQSATGAMSDIFAVQADSVERYVDALQALPNQIGAVFVLDEEPFGMDLFDHPATFRALLPKIARGYALDAIDRRQDREAAAGTSSRARVERFVSTVVAARGKSFPAAGLGESWRLLDPGVTGGALTLDGRLVHLSAFRG